jgi:hypothetical protein
VINEHLKRFTALPWHVRLLWFFAAFGALTIAMKVVGL